MRFAAGITLYNPSRNQIERIRNYEQSFEHIFLFDNSEPEFERFDYELSDNFTIITENDNKGLPYAFNAIIGHCQNYDFLCTLDQDSVFTSENIQAMERFITSYPGITSIGIVAPYIEYSNKYYTTKDSFEVKKWLITSGSFVNIKAFKKHSLSYDLNYFIDKFEIDLCMQFSRLGYSLLMYNGAVLYQSLGEQTVSKHSSHNPLRHYYLFRNRFYFNNKWYKGATKLFFNIAQTIKHYTLIMIYEPDKVAKIKASITAIDDYRNGRMGKKK